MATTNPQPDPEQPESVKPLALRAGSTETLGLLLLTRYVKDDGRNLLLYEHAGEHAS